MHLIISSCNKNKNKVKPENETHLNIYDEVNEDELCELGKLSLYENKWCEHEFERKIKYIYDIKIPNSMSFIHDN